MGLRTFMARRLIPAYSAAATVARGMVPITFGRREHVARAITCRPPDSLPRVRRGSGGRRHCGRARCSSGSGPGVVLGVGALLELDHVAVRNLLVSQDVPPCFTDAASRSARSASSSIVLLPSRVADRCP